MELIKIKLANQDYIIKQSFRSLMIFEKLTGKSVNDVNDSVDDVIKLLYSMLQGCNRETFKYTFDEFLDIIDDEPNIFKIFTDYLKDQAKAQEPNKPTKKKVNK